MSDIHMGWHHWARNRTFVTQDGVGKMKLNHVTNSLNNFMPYIKSTQGHRTGAYLTQLRLVQRLQPTRCQAQLETWVEKTTRRSKRRSTRNRWTRTWILGSSFEVRLSSSPCFSLRFFASWLHIIWLLFLLLIFHNIRDKAPNNHWWLIDIAILPSHFDFVIQFSSSIVKYMTYDDIISSSELDISWIVQTSVENMMFVYPKTFQCSQLSKKLRWRQTELR